MVIILGLVILVGAVLVGVAGVMGNGAPVHTVSHFSALGYHLTGSAGSLFLSGIVVGAAASQERDDLIEQRDTARATSNPSTSTAPQGPQLRESNDRWSRLRDMRRRLVPRAGRACHSART